MNIIRQLKIIYMLFKMKLSKKMMFRFSFFGVFFVDGTLFLMQLLMFKSIYSQVENVGGWNKNQMLLFIGTFSIINAVNMIMYFFGIITIPNKIKTGQLDLYITKPVNTLLYISFESIDIGSIPLLISSIGMVIYAALGMGIPITILSIIGYTFLVLIMIILWYDMMVIIRTISFFVIQTSSIERLEEEILSLCMKIPGNLFKGAFKVVFYLILPYGIMATIPTEFISGTLSSKGFIYAVMIVVIFTILTFSFWKFGLKNYKSASS